MQITAIVMLAIVFGNATPFSVSPETHVMNMYSAADRNFVGSFYLHPFGKHSIIAQPRLPLKFITHHPFISIVMHRHSIQQSMNPYQHGPDPGNHCDAGRRPPVYTVFHGQQSDLDDTDSLEIHISGCFDCMSSAHMRHYTFLMYSNDAKNRTPSIIACSETSLYRLTNDSNESDTDVAPSEDTDGNFASFLNQSLKPDAETYLYLSDLSSHVGNVAYMEKLPNGIRAMAFIHGDLGPDRLVGEVYPDEHVQFGCRTFGYPLMKRLKNDWNEPLRIAIHSEYHQNKTLGMILKFTHDGLSLFKPESEFNIMGRVLVVYRVLSSSDLSKNGNLQLVMCGKIRPVDEDDNKIVVDDFLQWGPLDHTLATHTHEKRWWNKQPI